MTDNEIKEMYLSLANGEKWECSLLDRNDNVYMDWQPFHLGDKIEPDGRYRKFVPKKELWIDEEIKSLIGNSVFKNTEAEEDITVSFKYVAKTVCNHILEEARKHLNSSNDDVYQNEEAITYGDLENVIKESIGDDDD